jgi:two-component system response regulator AtoC
MAALQVLVIDDEPALRQIMAAAVRKAGYSVDEAANAREASAKLVRGDVDVALCDIKLPDGNGMDILRDAKAAGIDTTFVMVTAFGSMETAVEALRAGAFDYVVKPVSSEELLHRVAQIAAMRGLRQENQVLRKAVSDQLHKLYQFTSPAMMAVERLVKKVAPTDSTVLITGESGTGKGVTAHRIHDLSARAGGAFVTVNCSAIPENLMESEFFGHTKGAFTSADRARKGLFLEADGGTLFLDEIGELPLPMQTKLLHVIEDKTVRAVGGEQARRVDVRIVAATNRDLQALVKEGRFREDLYFRLSMFLIPVPPLRERRGDMHGLIRHLLRESKYSGAGATDIDPLAEEALLSYGWPGNVRELDNVINRAHILADGQAITLADLPHDITQAVAARAAGTAIATEGYLRDQVRRFEADLITRAIAEAGGDRRTAAQKLGIGLSSLYRKLEEFERDGLICGASAHALYAAS